MLSPTKQQVDRFILLITNTPQTAAEVASQIGTNAQAVGRVLSYAASTGQIMSKRDPNQYADHNRMVYWKK